MGMDIVILSEMSQTQKTNAACSLSNVDPKSKVICVLGAYLPVLYACWGHIYVCLLVIKVQGGRDLKRGRERDGTRIHIIRIEKRGAIEKKGSHLRVGRRGGDKQTCEGAVVKPSTLYTVLKKLKTVRTKSS